MSAEDDRLVLTEYSEWRDGFQGVARNLTVGAFLAEREGRFNVNRIANALTILNSALPVFHRQEDDSHPNSVEPGAEDFSAAVGVLEEVRDLLQGDRPFIEQSTLTGPTTRTYL